MKPKTVLIGKLILGLAVVMICFQCEVVETCASCINPDYTIFVFDTTSNGFSPNEIDSFYIIRFDRGELNNPQDTSRLLIRQNPFFLSMDLFGTSTLDHDFALEGVNQEFRYEITDINYMVIESNDNCSCDGIEDKSLRVDGNLLNLADPFQEVVLRK